MTECNRMSVPTYPPDQRRSIITYTNVYSEIHGWEIHHDQGSIIADLSQTAEGCKKDAVRRMELEWNYAHPSNDSHVICIPAWMGIIYFPMVERVGGAISRKVRHTNLRAQIIYMSFRVLLIWQYGRVV